LIGSDNGSKESVEIGYLMIASDLIFFVASFGGLFVSLCLLYKKIKLLKKSSTKITPTVDDSKATLSELGENELRGVKETYGNDEDGREKSKMTVI
jgi:hypothetical protein